MSVVAQQVVFTVESLEVAWLGGTSTAFLILYIFSCPSTSVFPISFSHRPRLFNPNSSSHPIPYTVTDRIHKPHNHNGPFYITMAPSTTPNPANPNSSCLVTSAAAPYVPSGLQSTYLLALHPTLPPSPPGYSHSRLNCATRYTPAALWERRIASSARTRAVRIHASSSVE
jgi:hypothetical protein